MGPLQPLELRRRRPGGRGRTFWMAALMAALLWLGPQAARAASEERDFTAAGQEFRDKQYRQAEIDFTAFLNTYSNSPHAPEAALCLARAQASQSNYNGSIRTLEANLARADGRVADYIFYIAQATNALGHYQMAAIGWGNMVKAFPQSPLLLEAAYDEAAAWSKLNDWDRVIDLLSATNGAFQRAARGAGGNEFAANGTLLLAKAYLTRGRAPEGEAALGKLNAQNLGAGLRWERQFLLCQLELSQDKVAEAEGSSTNLIDLARDQGDARRALSLGLRGDILERAGKLAEALPCYTTNLAVDGLSENIQREALARALELMFRLGQTNAAVQLLEELEQRPRFGALDLVRVDLGELCLQAGAGAGLDATTAALLGTNLLQRAGTNLESALRDYPESPWAGRAHLDYGWRLWLETNADGAPTNVEAARTHFADAVRLLPHSTEQAVAQFKLGDAAFAEAQIRRSAEDTDGAAQSYRAARDSYNALLRDYGDEPAVTNKLFDLALYKLIEANLALGDEAQAGDAADKIMAWFPTSYYGGYGGLLLGEDLMRKNNYAQARREFSALTNKPTALAARAEFAIARTYGLEGKWDEALRADGQWVTNHPNEPLLPQVEFERALACDKSGQASNALTLMTNFAGRFASNSLAAWAQNWVADYYYNQGDFQKAEINYEELFDKWPNAEADLAYRARFMAGKAALGRQDPGEARGYFTNLINLPNTPLEILNESYFALADAIYQQDPKSATALGQAVAAVSKLTNGATTNMIAALALGRLGDFYYQGNDYAGAKQMYLTALGCSNVIDRATRSQLEIGLGRSALALQQTNEALQDFNLVLYHSDEIDPYWLSQAGQAAAEILENEQKWEVARNVYQRVLASAPSLRPILERKMATDQQNMDGAAK